MSIYNPGLYPDPQQAPAIGECARCGLELYWEDGEICDKCQRVLRFEEETA